MVTWLDLIVSYSNFQRGTTTIKAHYFALGFDQYAGEQAGNPTLVNMGHFETMEHISQYGRPLYVLSPESQAQLPTRLC